MDKEVTFNVFKNIIIEQNKVLLKQVAEFTGLQEQYLLEKYIKPEYYLPIIVKDPSKKCKDQA